MHAKEENLVKTFNTSELLLAVRYNLFTLTPMENI